MRIQSETHPALSYEVTPTSCTCPSRAKWRQGVPCKHMVKLIVRIADADRNARIEENYSWQQECESDRKDRDRQERRELARQREAA
jgi:hypothetical protein